MKLRKALSYKLPFKRECETKYRPYKITYKFSVKEILAEDWIVDRGELLRVGFMCDDDEYGTVYKTAEEAWDKAGTCFTREIRMVTHHEYVNV